METIELVGYVLVLILALVILAYGLRMLRGTGLLQRRKTEEYPFISRQHNPPEIDFPDTEGCGFHKKELEDDLE